MSQSFLDESDQTDHVDFEAVHEKCTHVRVSDRSSINVWLVFKEDFAVGFFVGTCTEKWYNREKSAEQGLWFVLKEFRHTVAPVLLIAAFEAWARGLGARLITTGCTNINSAAAVKSTLTKLGYQQVGTYHVKEI